MNEKERFNHKDAANYLGIADQTLYNWRNQRRGPDYILMGSKIRPVPLKSCIFSGVYAASLNSSSFFSNQFLLSLFLLIAVIDASAIEPFFDQLIPLFF